MSSGEKGRSRNVSYYISSEPFVHEMKFGMVVHHGPDCHATFLFGCYLQGQGHSERSNPQNITVSSISPETFC